jgi:hypothetical protein
MTTKVQLHTHTHTHTKIQSRVAVTEAGDSSGTQEKGTILCWKPLPEDCWRHTRLRKWICKSLRNPVTNPNLIYSHSVAWQYYKCNVLILKDINIIKVRKQIYRTAQDSQFKEWQEYSYIFIADLGESQWFLCGNYCITICLVYAISPSVTGFFKQKCHINRGFPVLVLLLSFDNKMTLTCWGQNNGMPQGLRLLYR